MSTIVTCDCFKGFHQIAKNCYSKETLQCYIDEWEPYFLNKLLGCELATLICDYVNGRKTNPGGTPINDNYETILNKFCKTTNSYKCGCGSKCEAQSKGIKWVLTGLIYYKYMSVEPYTSTSAGPVRLQSSNSIMISHFNLRRVADIRHNDAKKSYDAIQACIVSENKNNDPQPFPEFNGCEIKPVLTDIL